MEILPIGFDVRMMAADYVQEVWSPERRMEYLLRTNVEWPMSIDPAVWPSLRQSHYFNAHGRRILNPRLIRKDTAHLENELGLFRDQSSLDEIDTAQHGVRIGIEIILINTKDAGPFGGLVAAPVPQVMNIIGFDIATEAPISGLCNCGYAQAELDRLRHKWECKLNEYGLLTDIEDAQQFQEMTNKRVPEHAPFYIYKLSRIV
jgi:hypothetical protein